MKTFKPFILTALCVSLVTMMVMATSCSKTTEPPPSTPTSVPQANDSLGALLSDVMDQYFDDTSSISIGNDSSFRPRDIDFSGVYNMYTRILQSDPANVDAKFGAALTGALVFLGDPDFNNLLDDFKQIYDTMQFNPFNPAPMAPGINVPGSLSPQGLPLAPAGLLGVIPSPMRLEQAILASAAQIPQINELQANFEQRLLPKVVTSRNWMIDVLAVPSFTFWLTPEMQGNDGADSLVFDRAVFEAILATLYGAEAALHIVLARDLDLPEYTVEAAQDALHPDSSFLDLKPGGVGATHMSQAGDRVCSAQVMLSAAVQSLLTEVRNHEDQSRDFLRVYPKDTVDLNEVADSLASIHLSLTTGARAVTFEMDNGTFLTITADLMQFFNNPLDNPKRFLPDYTVTASELQDHYKDFAAAHYDRDQYWQKLDSAYGITRPYDTPLVPIHLPDANTDEFYELIARYDYWPDTSNQFYLLGWDDLQNWCEGCGFFAFWSPNSSWRYRDYYRHPDQVAVCAEWTANSFSEWIWPQPTFNGLLPGMTTQQIRDIFTTNFDYQWEKSGCDTVGVDIDWPQE
jgi:hypothetical protein